MNPLADERITLADGMTIPVLALGTFEQKGQKCTDVVRWALEVGYRAIDTAEAYYNQPLIAPALKEVKREELFVTSKLWRGTYTRDAVEPAVDKILSELDVDYLDLLLIHWPDKAIPIGETLEAMEKVREKGKVRSLGVSNFTIRHVQDALDIGIQIVTNQVEFHPYLYQTQLKTFCEENGIKIMAYSPLARGEVIRDPHLQKLGNSHRKTAAQVSLRWAIQHGCIVLVKASSRERLEENANVFDFELSAEEVASIDALHRDHRTILPDFHEFDYA